jgi:hypothetical protein
VSTLEVAQRSQLDRINALHIPSGTMPNICEECSRRFPCQTSRIINAINDGEPRTQEQKINFRKRWDDHFEDNPSVLLSDS